MQNLDSIKEEMVIRLKERLNTDLKGIFAATSVKSYVEKAVLDILAEVVGPDNVKAYGIHFRGEDFFIYAANSDEA